MRKLMLLCGTSLCYLMTTPASAQSATKPKPRLEAAKPSSQIAAYYEVKPTKPGGMHKTVVRSQRNTVAILCSLERLSFTSKPDLIVEENKGLFCQLNTDQATPEVQGGNCTEVVVLKKATEACPTDDKTVGRGQ